ncbi:MAG: AI-2E family transporter [Cyanobacteria bacterium]|nr:AI-2E family transporter [Cyanobacteriota bacterium]
MEPQSTSGTPETSLKNPPQEESQWLYLFKILMAIVSSLMVAYVLIQLAGLFYGIVVLLALSIVFSYILLIPVNGLESLVTKLSRWALSHKGFRSFALQTPKIRPRLLAVILVYFGFFLFLSVGMVWLVPQLSHQVKGFGKDFPQYIQQIESSLVEATDAAIGSDSLKKMFRKDIEQAEKQGVVPPHPLNSPQITEEEKKVIGDSVFKKTLSHTTHFLENAASLAIENVVVLVAQALNGIVYFLCGLVLVFYFLLDGKKLRQGILQMLPQSFYPTASYFFQSVHQVMFNFVKGQVLLAFVSGFFMFILYSVFHVKYALFLSSFFTVAEVLPVIGPWIAFTPGIMVVLFSEHPEHAFYIWALYVLIKDNFILPQVVGEVMGLHPVMVIFSILICAKVGGFLGVVLALPVASVISVMLRYYLNPPPPAELTQIREVS